MHITHIVTHDVPDSPHFQNDAIYSYEEMEMLLELAIAANVKGGLVFTCHTNSDVSLVMVMPLAKGLSIAAMVEETVESMPEQAEGSEHYDPVRAPLKETLQAIDWRASVTVH